MAETNIVAGLFGMNPQMYERQLYQQDIQQGYDLARLDPGAAARAQLPAGIGQLGRGFAGAMGIEDPQLKMISQTNQLMQGLNLRDPQSLVNAAQQASQMGNTGLALKLLDLSDKAQVRMQQIQAQQEALQARQISQQAFQPGTPERPQMLDVQEREQMADQGTPLPENIAATAPSYDVGRVANRLLATTAGRAEYKSILEAQEASAKTSKLAAEAITAQAKADVAVPSERADALRKTAEANKAVIESQFTQRLQVAGLNKANWDVLNLQSQIRDRSAKLGLDVQMTNATVLEKMASIAKMQNDIPADTRKLINESAVTAATAKQSANQFNDLANRIETEGGNYGVASSASDFMKKIGGFQGGMTQLKQEYTRLRNTAAIKSLPPGPATDKDIQMALSGFPSDTARASDLAQFLRGMAKLQDIDASVSNAKTDWLAQNNGTLTRANRNIMVGDFRAKPGESFEELSSRIAVDVNARYAGTGREAQRQTLINQIPTNQQSGTPALANSQNSILQQADAIILNKR